MATSEKRKKKSAEGTVTRIKASDGESSGLPKAKPTTAKKKTVVKKEKNQKPQSNDSVAEKSLGSIKNYFKGAWQELRLVRWPDRRSTWGMTGALIVFTTAFLIVILLLDYGFSWLFKLIMGTN